MVPVLFCGRTQKLNFFGQIPVKIMQTLIAAKRLDIETRTQRRWCKPKAGYPMALLLLS